MAISTTRLMRADRWHTLSAFVATVAAVSILQVVAPGIAHAQGPQAPKSPVRVTQSKPKAHTNPANAVMPNDTEADQLNEKWLSDFNKVDKPAPDAVAASATPASATPAPAAAAPKAPTAPVAAAQPAPAPAAPAPAQAQKAPATTADTPPMAAAAPGTESDRTLPGGPTAAAVLPGAGARVVMPGSVTFVKADSAAAAFNSLGGANQPLFKDLNDAFSGFAIGGAKVQMMQARTADGTNHPIYASIGEDQKRQSYWWFSPPGQPEGWFDDKGKRLGGTALAEPKPGARISSPFGTRRFYGRVTSTAFHNGIDFEGKTGEPIYAAADGVVNHANWYYNYGRTVKITHADNFETLYAHMSRIAPNIQPGVTVHRGDVIGYIGATGRAYGSHLHFSTIVNGQFVDPEPYISENGGYATLSGQDLVSFRKWQQDVRAAAVAQGATQRASLWSRNPFTPPPAPGQL